MPRLSRSSFRTAANGYWCATEWADEQYRLPALTGTPHYRQSYTPDLRFGCLLRFLTVVAHDREQNLPVEPGLGSNSIEQSGFEQVAIRQDSRPDP